MIQTNFLTAKSRATNEVKEKNAYNSGYFNPYL